MKAKTEHMSLKETVAATLANLGPVVAQRWRVEEIRPAHTSSGYDSVDYPDELMGASPWFGEAEQARDFMNSHVAAPGAELRIRFQKGYDKVQRIWI